MGRKKYHARVFLLTTWKALLYDASTMKTGGELLRAWRERQKLKQAEAAEYLELDNTFLSKLETGHRQPGRINSIKIERKTGIPVEAWESIEVDKSELAAASVGRKRKD